MSHALGIPPYDGTLQDTRIQIAIGHITGMSFVHKFGANAAAGTTREDIWSEGGVYNWPTAAVSLRVAPGGNAADTSDGAGARTIVVEGLDENFNQVSETITLAGASASAATTTTFFRVFRSFVLTSGTYTGANVGDIDIEDSSVSPENKLAHIEAADGQTQMTHYTVPENKKAYLTNIGISSDSNKSFNIRVMQRQNADTVAAPFTSPRILYEVETLTQPHNDPIASFIELSEKTDIWADAKVKTGSGSVTLHYDLLLVND